MNHVPETDVFDITLSNEGSLHLERLYKLTRWLFLLVIGVAIVFVTNMLLQYATTSRYFSNHNLPIPLRARVLPFYAVIILILTMLQIYCYAYFTRVCKRAIEHRHNELFNHSFKWLVRNTILAGCTMIVELIINIFFLYTDYETLRTVQ